MEISNMNLEEIEARLAEISVEVETRSGEELEKLEKEKQKVEKEKLEAERAKLEAEKELQEIKKELEEQDNEDEEKEEKTSKRAKWEFVNKEVKNGFMKKIIICVITIFCIALVIILMSNLFDSSDISNTVGNIRNYGYASEDGGWIYFLSPNEENSKVGIFKVKNNGLMVNVAISFKIPNASTVTIVRLQRFFLIRFR